MRNVGIKEVDGKDKADATGGKSCGGEKIAAGIAQPKFGATSPLPPNGKKFLGILMQIFVDQPKSGATLQPEECDGILDYKPATTSEYI